MGELETELAGRIRSRYRPTAMTAARRLADRGGPDAARAGLLAGAQRPVRPPPGPRVHRARRRQGRPSGLVSRADHQRRDAPVRSLMLVSREMPLAAVGRRAMARPTARRFDPLMCCDEAGRYAGLVRIERILDSLAWIRRRTRATGSVRSGTADEVADLDHQASESSHARGARRDVEREDALLAVERVTGRELARATTDPPATPIIGLERLHLMPRGPTTEVSRKGSMMPRELNGETSHPTPQVSSAIYWRMEGAGRARSSCSSRPRPVKLSR